MKNLKTIVFGILLVALGVALALKAFDLISFNVFFDGWWTLLFIIPALFGLFTERDKTGNVIVLAVFTLIFLSSQSFIESELVWKLAAPVIIIAIGASIVFSSIFKRSKVKESKNAPAEHGMRENFAAFSGSDVDLCGETFEGARLTAVFGGIKYDLRGAVIEDGCEIRLTAIFGGIDVIVPEGVNVKMNVMGLFGGASDKTKKKDGEALATDASSADGTSPTLYINGECIFGGAEAKR